MNDAQHLEVADRLMRLAERLRIEGDDVAMCEMLWGTVNRITNALAIHHNLAAGSRMPRGGSVIHHLVNHHNAGAELQDNWLSAGALHGHFYNSHLEPADLEDHVTDAQALIAELRNLYNGCADP
jgi:hypothetical protein